MHAIHELVCGIRGAEDGTVDIYERGTSTRAVYYTSYEGDGATTPTAALALDANGGGAFYVNETCDVVVRDAGGTEVRRFTSATAASAVEVISQSFTGTDYETGASAVSEPVTMATVLDLWKTNAGAEDWKVLVGGVKTKLQTALGSIGVLFFSVKDPIYGATGDGSTDDAAAIQAALDAAETAGGGIVFFPKGTYRHTTRMSVAAGVSLLGAGPGASRVAAAGGGSGGFIFDASPTYWQSVEGLRIDATAASSDVMLNMDAGCRMVVRNCAVGNSNNNGLCFRIGVAGSEVWFNNTVFETSASSGQYGLVLAAADVSTHFNGCDFNLPASGAGSLLLQLRSGGLYGCRFVTSAFASGTVTLLDPTTSGARPFTVIGCRADNPAGGTVTLMSDGSGTGYDNLFMAANQWGTSIVRPDQSASAAASSYAGSLSLDAAARRYYVASDAAGVTLETTKFALFEVVRTTNGAQTVTLDVVGPVDRSITLVYYNNQVGVSGTITMAGDVKGLTTFTVNASSVSYYFFRAVHRGTSSYWALVGSLTNQTP